MDSVPRMLQENSREEIEKHMTWVEALKKHPILGHFFVRWWVSNSPDLLDSRIDVVLYTESGRSASRSIIASHGIILGVGCAIDATKYVLSMLDLAVLNMMDELRLEVRDPEESAFWYPKTCGRQGRHSGKD